MNTAYHRTKTGHIEKLDEYGHGKAARGRWAWRPATIEIDDGDGHTTVWAYSGDRWDAIALAASFDAPTTHDYDLIVDGNSVSFGRIE